MILSALLLSAILYFTARHEAEYSLPYMLLVSAGLWLVNLVLGLTLGPVGYLLGAPVTAWALHQFCYVRWGKAILATVIYFALQLGLAILLTPHHK